MSCVPSVTVVFLRESLVALQFQRGIEFGRGGGAKQRIRSDGLDQALGGERPTSPQWAKINDKLNLQPRSDRISEFHAAMVTALFDETSQGDFRQLIVIYSSACRRSN